MSQGTTPAPQPQPGKPSWLSMATSIALALFAVYQEFIKANPAPVINNPQPVIVNPAPAPPTPIVVPQPSPNALGVVITDVHLQPIGNTVPARMLFFVQADAGITLTALPSNEADADIDDTKDASGRQVLKCVLRDGCTLQVVIVGKGRPSVLTIRTTATNTAPVVVPPNGNTTPSPTPQPIVTPAVYGPVTIGFIDDATDRSQEMCDIVNSWEFWQKYRAAGHTFRIVQGGKDPTKTPEGVKLLDALQHAGKQQPGLVVTDRAGNVLYAESVPSTATVATLASILYPFTGVK